MESIQLPGGVFLLQPSAVVAIGPHGDGTALYTAGGVVLCADTPENVLALLQPQHDEAAGAVPPQTPA